MSAALASFGVRAFISQANQSGRRGRIAPQQLDRRTPRGIGGIRRRVALSKARPVVSAVQLQDQTGESEDTVLKNESFETGVTVTVTERRDVYEVTVTCNPPRPGAVAHWGVEDWLRPDPVLWPPSTHDTGGGPVETPLEWDGQRFSAVFPKDSTCPGRMVLVIRDAENNWDNNGGACYSAYLRPPGLESVANDVIVREAKDTTWGLYPRYALMNEKLDAMLAAGVDGAGFLLTWSRLNSLRQLDWYRGYNYQSKDMDHMQKTLSDRLALAARSHKDPAVRRLVRATAAVLPRGGGDAEAIRMGILHIMRDFGIREGHRPGIDEKFLEQWHQKLHQNSNVDDIAIGEAYLAYLSSEGNFDEFKRVLWEVGRLTWEDLGKMSQPIVNGPMYLPHLYDAFKGYVWQIRRCHSGADLDVCLDAAEWRITDDGLKWNLRDLQTNRFEWWAPGKAVEIREQLAGFVKGPEGNRDLLMLDIALEEMFRRGMEGADLRSVDRDGLLGMMDLCLRSASLSLESEEFYDIRDAWGQLQGDGNKWSREWSLRAAAVLERAAILLSALADEVAEVTQRHTEAFAEQCATIKPEYVTSFGEEVARGIPSFFAPLRIIRPLEEIVREAAGMGPWDVASLPAGESARGAVLVVDSLTSPEAQEALAPGAPPRVVVVSNVTGAEDIPLTAVAVLSRAPIDLLSHIAIRARGQGTLLAHCADGGVLDEIAAKTGVVDAIVADGSVRVVAVEGDATAGVPGAAKSGGPALRLVEPAPSDRWCVGKDVFSTGVVGAKASRVHVVSSKIGSHAAVPPSCALPFGAFERCVRLRANERVEPALRAAVGEVAQWGDRQGAPSEALARARAAVTQLMADDELRAEVERVAAEAGVAQGPTDWDALWDAIRGVWASQWGERAWLARRSAGIPEGKLRMSVLLQPVVPVAYSFVLHSADPLSGERGVVSGEVVAGLGEALVGNYPGRALRFKARAGEGAEVLSLPSKNVMVMAPEGHAIIARSDSNGEDLKGYSGAGLYDSIIAGSNEATRLAAPSVKQEPLIWDYDFRVALIDQLASLARFIEEACDGEPQDIEGCVDGDGVITVVQIRPQN